jgi:hypothetical protein
MHSLRICREPARISLIPLAHLAVSVSRDVQIKRIESIFENLIQHPSTTRRDHAWLNVLLLLCVQG